MSMKTKIAIVVSSAAVLLFMYLGGLDGVRASNNDGSYRQLQVYSEVLSRVRSEYVEEPNIPLVTDGALHGLLESLDSNSSYLTAAEFKEYKANQTEAKGEIGAGVSKRFGYAAVISVIPGGPADKAGIQASDIFEAIEGKSTREMSLAEIHNLLLGQPGSNLNVSVVRARRAEPSPAKITIVLLGHPGPTLNVSAVRARRAEPQKMVITRDIVAVPAVADKMVDDGIGYIQVDAFNKGKEQEVAAKVRALQKSGAKKLILDLRNCAEGDEGEGIAVANLFLNHGTITYLQGQKYPRQAFNADASKAITNLPLAVLVNKGTAGPAEVVAAAILENARGDVVGDKTFGDGSIQKTMELPDGSALILSIAKYYTPRGKAIQDAAVTPNVLIADSPEDDGGLPDEDQPATPDEKKEVKPKNQIDDQLNKALEVLKNREAKG